MVVTNARLFDPSAGTDGLYNIYVMGGRVASFKLADEDKTGITLGAQGLEVVDAAGRLVVPGLVDIHTHLREPGYEYKETIRTGSLAAAAGGFTSILCMANMSPVNDNSSVTRYILKKAESAPVAVYPVGAVTVGLKGAELSEMGDLKEAGCVAVSDDGMPVVSSSLMRKALEYSRTFDLPVITHAEEPRLAGSGAMNEGDVATRLGLPGIPNAAEDVMVSRDIELAALTGGRLHVAHVSTRGSVELVRRARERGLSITAEVTPHHLTLTEADVDGYDTNAKMNPPLRTAEDVEALREALKDGTIDVIATDHAPHAVIDKDVEFTAAANGIVGLETAFSLVYGLVSEGVLPLERAIAAMTINPARAMKIDKGSLRVGSQADMAVIDTGREWTVDPSKFRSKGRNTPYAGRTLRAVVVKTIVAGRVVFEAGG